MCKEDAHLHLRRNWRVIAEVDPDLEVFGGGRGVRRFLFPPKNLFLPKIREEGADAPGSLP